MASSRRIDVRRILADPDLRRKLMVSTIQATQAREGIETTPEQAERAYYVVTEGERATFFDLTDYQGGKGEPDRRHEVFVSALRDEIETTRFDVARRDFSAIEGTPLAYRRVGFVAHIFRDAPALEPAWGIARQGKATADDLRWVRQFWEVISCAGWVPFAKGGDFCRFYADIDLALDWKPEHREALKASGNGLPSSDYYFKPGLTWPRACAVFSVRILPEKCIFADKGPAIFPKQEEWKWFLLGVLNSAMTLCFGRTLTSREKMGARWEVGAVKRFPIPKPSSGQWEIIGSVARAIHDMKKSWDKGNEISTSFAEPWLLRNDLADLTATLPTRLHRLLEFEASEGAQVQRIYVELNDEVYRLYGIPENTRKSIEETLGKRPQEVIWPQMAGKSVEQKRMEHVWRLLSYVVKRVVEREEDGIVPFCPLAGKQGLLDRVYGELEALFPSQSISQVEVEIVNELKHKVKGYPRVESIRGWLEEVFFEYHASLYKNRPVIWHIASRSGRGTAAFGALVHYHRFDKNGMAKLRGIYLREALDFLRREAALAGKEGRGEDRLEWLSNLEEAEALDRRLQLVQEGHCEGPEGGDGDFRILTPWKTPDQLPKGWDPDLDDGVKVNIEPLQKAGVFRISKVV